MTEMKGPEDPIDEVGEESFPASDPPEWTGLHAGEPAVARAPRTDDLRTVRSAFDVAETIGRVERVLNAAGTKVFAKIDQAAEARAVGLTLRPAVVLLFGNPKTGTPLMNARPTVAIDLPLKALVWEDEAGATWLTYNTPALLVRRHALDPALAANLAPVGTMLEGAVKAT